MKALLFVCVCLFSFEAFAVRIEFCALELKLTSLKPIVHDLTAARETVEFRAPANADMEFAAHQSEVVADLLSVMQITQGLKQELKLVEKKEDFCLYTSNQSNVVLKTILGRPYFQVTLLRGEKTETGHFLVGATLDLKKAQYVGEENLSSLTSTYGSERSFSATLAKIPRPLIQ